MPSSETRDDGHGVQLRASIEDVRIDQRSNRNRAILTLARHDAEYVGYPWDGLPWRDDDWGADQAYYVMHAMERVDHLIERGFITP